MSASDLLQRLQAAPPGAALDWRKIREEIHDEHERATTTEERVILLGIFKAVMDLIERSDLDHEDLEKFREARLTDYRLLIVKEALIGENVCTETLDTVTQREISAGRMSPDDSLRETAVVGMAAPHLSRVELILDACVEYARRILASQLPLVESGNYDFMPQFKERTIRLYLAGVMYRFGEQFDLPTNARDRGFICLMSMLITDGMGEKAAKAYIAETNALSSNAKGQDSPILVAGYNAVEGDGSLARVFDGFRNEPTVSGAPYRLLDRSKPIAIILAAAGFAIAILIGRTFGEALGIGIIFGLSTLAIALVIYRQMVKKNGT